MKNKRRKIINIYALISILFFLLGIEVAYYFYAGVNNFLKKVPFEFVEENVIWFSYAIIILTFLNGFIFGIKALNTGLIRKFAIVIILLDVAGILSTAFVCGFGIYTDYKGNEKVVMESRENFIVQNDNVSESNTNDKNINTGNRNTVEKQEADVDKQKKDEPIVTEQPQATRTEVPTLTETPQSIKDKKMQYDNEKKKQEEKNEDIQISEETETQQELWNTKYSVECGENVGTWEDAYRKCRQNNAHLITFENKEEFDYVSEKLTNMGYQDYIFYLGGRRDLDSDGYYWINDNNSLEGNTVNNAESWAAECWLEGEPSFKDDSLGVEEHVMCMFYDKNLGRWAWNDIPNDLVSANPIYEGKMGIIYEYEN